MKRLALASLAACFVSLPVAAADLPIKAPSLASPIRATSWAGLYAGVHVGYEWGSSNWFQPASGLSIDTRTTGGIVGGQLGYNYAFNNFIAGIETDLSWSGNKGSTIAAGCAVACETKNTWLGSTRVRLGVPLGAAGEWLPYVTGGVAYGGVQVSDLGITRRSTRYGWTLGAGTDYALTSTWSARLEYLYTDLGKFTTIGDGTAPPFDVKFHSHLLRAGLNYRF